MTARRRPGTRGHAAGTVNAAGDAAETEAPAGGAADRPGGTTDRHRGAGDPPRVTADSPAPPRVTADSPAPPRVTADSPAPPRGQRDRAAGPRDRAARPLNAAPASDRGTLFVVATPIGNLADITLRALDVLRSVAVIAAEDTRTTGTLFERHGIPKRDEAGSRLVSYHAHNAARRAPELLEQLRSGRDVALVTDAGTPGISDPGAELVGAWAAENGSVVPIPGASAALAALVASGIAGPRWSFEGFLPRRGRARRERLARIAGDDRATAVFEAANRTAATLADLAEACGPARPAAVCRELTKLHEEIVRGTLGELRDRAREGALTLRGEIVVVVGHAAEPDAATDARPDAANERGGSAAAQAGRQEVERLVAAGMGRVAAVRRVAASSGIRRRLLYERPVEHAD